MAGSVFIPFPGAAAPVMLKAVERVLTVIEAETKRWAPVDTGTLRNSYTQSTRMGFGIDPSGLVSTNVFYAPFVEFGTRNMSAQPHLSKGAQAAVTRRMAEWVSQ